MAKKIKQPDDLVTVVAGSWFKHNGQQVRPNDHVQMTDAEAQDLVALKFARWPKPDELVRG